MKQNNVNIGIVPDKRRMKDDGTFPLKLRLACKGVRKYYATGYDINLQDWKLYGDVLSQRGCVSAQIQTQLEI